jgi:hypothetical protein
MKSGSGDCPPEELSRAKGSRIGPLVNFPIAKIVLYSPIQMKALSGIQRITGLGWKMTLLYLAPFAGAQEGSPSMIQAVPTSEFVTVPEGSNVPLPTAAAPPSSSLPPQRPDLPPQQPASMQVAPPAPSGLPQGVTVSDQLSRSREIVIERAQRVPVYPDDPETAWWEINPSLAFARAQREQKPLLLLFTATWNTQAMALSEEVFATKSFNEYVKKNLVICYLPYPRNPTDAHPALRAIKEKFKVKGLPNTLIFNTTGEVHRGITGYRTGRPVDYFNELQAACRPILDSIANQREGLVARGYRDWSSYQGKIIFADFVEHDRTRVVLRDVSGQLWVTKINNLAPADQKLVESFPAVATLQTLPAAPETE